MQEEHDPYSVDVFEDGSSLITLLGSFTTNETPSISPDGTSRNGTATLSLTAPISKVIPEDSLTTWVTGELNATDLDTNSAQLRMVHSRCTLFWHGNCQTNGSFVWANGSSSSSIKHVDLFRRSHNQMPITTDLIS